MHSCLLRPRQFSNFFNVGLLPISLSDRQAPSVLGRRRCSESALTIPVDRHCGYQALAMDMC
jgi:hypothetical protein